MNDKNVLILGGGGIIGQHMLLTEPSGYNCLITRTEKTSNWWISFNSKTDNIKELLSEFKPDYIINLSGENRVDVVEKNPDSFYYINVNIPEMIADWCKNKKTYYIQCSTQGVFSGNNATYSPGDNPHPITEYGKQKRLAEQAASSIENSEIARLTFVLGIRPFQSVGRKNPLEDMIEKENQLQVDDRFFSPLFAHDAAEILWNKIIQNDSSEKIYHLGNPIRCSRFTIASDLMYNLNNELNNNVQPVSHETFIGLAQRPFDTTWKKDGTIYIDSFEDGLIKSYWQWRKVKNGH